MKRAVWISWCFFILFSGTCWGISGEDIQRLNKAGLSADTIQLVIREKVIETCAFSVQELIDLKVKARLSEKTLQMLITEGSFLRNRSPVVYGQDHKQLEIESVDDIIELKQAGISDDILQAMIISGSDLRSASDRDRAWQMLNHMGIVVDTRKHHE